MSSSEVFSQKSDDASVKEQGIEVVLGIDKIRKLDFTPSTKVQVGNQSLLNYQLIPQKREITFKGKKAGKTSVILRDNVGDIKAKFLVTITSTNQSKQVKELREFIGDIEGIEVGIKGGKVYVGGEIIVPKDIGIVVVALEQFPEVINLVQLSPQTQRIIAQKMQDEIQKGVGSKDVTVRVVNGRFWVEGVLTSNGQVGVVKQIAEGYLPDKLPDLARQNKVVQFSTNQAPIQYFLSVNSKKQKAPTPKMIKIIAQFVELTKDFGREYGFRWEPLLADNQGEITFGKKSDGSVSTSSNGTLVGTITNLFPKLQSAKSAGYARVIQHAMALTKDRQKTSIKKVTTIPYELGNGDFTKGQTASTGIDLKAKPSLLDGEKIELELGLSVSINAGNNNSAVMTTENSISTTIIVKSKESAVVGGVVTGQSKTDFDKNAPGEGGQTEGSSPLFSFIRSKKYFNNKSQFVMFITPEVVESASSGTAEIKKKFRWRKR